MSSVPSGIETESPLIPYASGVTFSSTPSVVITCNSWIALQRILTTSQTTSGFKALIMHNQGSSVGCIIKYIAIGKK